MNCANIVIIIFLIVLIINFLKSDGYKIKTKQTQEAFTSEWGYQYKSLKKDWKPTKTSKLQTFCPTKIDGKCITY